MRLRRGIEKEPWPEDVPEVLVDPPDELEPVLAASLLTSGRRQYQRGLVRYAISHSAASNGMYCRRNLKQRVQKLILPSHCQKIESDSELSRAELRPASLSTPSC